MRSGSPGTTCSTNESGSASIKRAASSKPRSPRRAAALSRNRRTAGLAFPSADSDAPPERAGASGAAGGRR